MNSILYYPTIDVLDERWAKYAVLYWDEICTIVPHKDFKLPKNVSLLKEHNCYRPIYPEDIFQKNANIFLETLERRFWDLPRKEIRTVRIHDSKLFYMHSFELAEHYPEVYKLFNNLTQAQDNWKEIGEKAATVYMKTLAEFAVDGVPDIEIGTSSAVAFPNGYGKPIFGEGFQVTIQLNGCIPMPRANVPLEEIIAFKTQNRDALIDFRRKLSQFEASLQQCQSSNDYKDAYNDFDQEMKDAIEYANSKVFDFETIPGTIKSAINIPAHLPETLLVFSDLTRAAFTGAPSQNILAMVLSQILTGGATSIAHKISINVQKRKECKSKYPYIMRAARQGLLAPSQR